MTRMPAVRLQIKQITQEWDWTAHKCPWECRNTPDSPVDYRGLDGDAVGSFKYKYLRERKMVEKKSRSTREKIEQKKLKYKISSSLLKLHWFLTLMISGLKFFHLLNTIFVSLWRFRSCHLWQDRKFARVMVQQKESLYSI